MFAGPFGVRKVNSDFRNLIWIAKLCPHFVIFTVSGWILSPKGRQTITRWRRVLRTTEKSLSTAAQRVFAFNVDVRNNIEAQNDEQEAWKFSFESQGLSAHFVIFIVSGWILSPKGRQTTTRWRRVLRTTVKSLQVAADCIFVSNCDI